tara:strand:- start:208198 stop:209625 length:1428 start_codon:yes stop_codon:yes gene_type:complete
MNFVDSSFNRSYLDSIVIGDFQPGRGTSSVSTFGELDKYDVSKYYPLSTASAKKFEYIIRELCWFMRGETNVNMLNAPIWDSWDQDYLLMATIYEKLDPANVMHLAIEELKLGAEYLKLKRVIFTSPREPEVCFCFDLEPGKVPVKLKRIDDLDYSRDELVELSIDVLKKIGVKVTTGKLGPVYGQMFRAWPNPDGGAVDQVKEFIDNLRDNPFSRRHIISLWNAAVLPDEKAKHHQNIANGKAVLPPCHMTIQANVRYEKVLQIVNPNWREVVSYDHVRNAIRELINYTVKHELYAGSDAATYLRATFQFNENYSAYDVYDSLIDTMYRSDFIEDYDKRLDFLKVACNLIDLELDNDYLESYLDEKIVDLLFFMRSNDKPVGKPYNVASYAAFMYMISICTGYKIGILSHANGNGHVYTDQIHSIVSALEVDAPELPTLKVKNRGQKYPWQFKESDFELIDYNPGKFIRHNVNV